MIINVGLNSLNVGLVKTVTTGGLIVSNNSYAKNNLTIAITFDGVTNTYPITGDSTTFIMPTGLHTYRMTALETNSFIEGSFVINSGQNTTISTQFGKQQLSITTAYVVQSNGSVAGGTIALLNSLRGQDFTIVYQQMINLAFYANHFYLVYSANTYSVLNQTNYNNLVASGVPYNLLFTY